MDIFKQIESAVIDATVEIIYKHFPPGVYRVTAKDQKTLARIAAKSAEITERHTKHYLP